MNGILIPFMTNKQQNTTEVNTVTAIPKYYTGVSFVSKFSLSISSDHFTEYGESL
jgi:hypothetical protein